MVRRRGLGGAQAAAIGLGLGLMVVSFFVFWLSNRSFTAGRADLMYLADAFLHLRVWIPVGVYTPNAPQVGENDVIVIAGRIFVPFAPFPAIALMPLVAIIGPVNADYWETGINAALAATVVGLSFWVSGRIGVRQLPGRLFLALLMGFSTQIWWVTTRGGVWHTGHLIATILVLLLIAEMFGRQRALLMGFLVGLGFLTRAPLAFAGPGLALWVLHGSGALDGGRSLGDRGRALPWRDWGLLIAGFAPGLAFFLFYNWARFGSVVESGYGLASLPGWLEDLRRQGLFSPVHIRMNIDYLFLKLPRFTAEFPWFKPDGLGMSVLFTSPALFLGLLAPWRDRRTWILLATAVLVLTPTLLYYGGGWLQYGYRYFLDSIPFVWAMVGLYGVKHRGGYPWWAWVLLGWGVLVGAAGVYWAYHI
jgi:hypothetical protein